MELLKMEQINITVAKYDKFIVYIDPLVWTKEALKEWSDDHITIVGIKELAEVISVCLVHYGKNVPINGFGYIKEVDYNGESCWDDDFIPQFCEGITFTNQQESQFESFLD